VKLCVVARTIMKGDGQGRVNYEVVLEALRRGYCVTLLATNVDLSLQQHPQVEWVNIPVQQYPSQLLGGLIFSYQTANWLRQHRQQFNIVKVNGANTSVTADINAVHFVHSSWLKSSAHPARLTQNPYTIYQWLYTWLNAGWERKAFQQAKMLVAVSEKVKQELIDIGVASDRIRVIPNGVDLQEFVPGFCDRDHLGLPKEAVLALFVGDIRTSRKNLDTVLHALLQVPKLHLAVVGSTERSPYPQLVNELNLSHRVHFLGYRKDVASIMQAADLFVFPSRYEACTLVLLEAMASGLPIITAITAGGSELVTPDCGIVLADSDNQDVLANALTTLVQDRQLRQQMGQAARGTAEQYSWSAMASAYLELSATSITSDKSEYLSTIKETKK
jgi:glycosyltransferase involved in cell wall biosynthesis